MDMRARAIIEAVDKTGKTFDNIAKKMGAVDKAAKAMEKAAAITKTSKQVDDLRKNMDTLSKIEAFRQIKQDINAARPALLAARNRVIELKTAMDQTVKPTRAMSTEMARARKEARTLQASFDDQRRSMLNMRGALRERGVSLGAMSRHEEKLNRTVDRGTRALERRAARAEMRQRVGATAGAVGSAIVSTPALLGGAGLAYGAAKSVKTYAELEGSVTRLGLTAEATDEQISAAMQTFRAQGPALGATAKDMAGAAEQFVAAGLDFNTAVGAVPAAIKATKASGGELTDLTSAGIAAIQQFGYTADNVERAFDLMSKAGKEGRYELKNMAKDMPSIGAGAKRMGLANEQGMAKTLAALEIIRESVGSSDEAANRWENVVQKAFIQETSKNFKKFNVDLEKEIKEGAKKGKDALQVLLELTKRVTGGDQFKMAQLFNDMQAQQGIQALVTNLDRLEELKNKILREGPGTMGNDFKRWAKTTQQAMDEVESHWDRLLGRLGEKMAPFLKKAMDFADKALDATETTPEQGNEAQKRINRRLNRHFLGVDSDATYGAAYREREETEAPLRRMRELDDQIGAVTADADAADRNWGTRGQVNAARRRAADAKIAALRQQKDGISQAVDARNGVKADLARNKMQLLQAQVLQRNWGGQIRPLSPIGVGANGIGSDMLPGGRLPTGGRWDAAPKTAPLPPTRPAFPAASTTPMLQSLDQLSGKVEATLKPDQVTAKVTEPVDVTGKVELTGAAQVSVSVKVDGGTVTGMSASSSGNINASVSSGRSMPGTSAPSAGTIAP